MGQPMHRVPLNSVLPHDEVPCITKFMKPTAPKRELLTTEESRRLTILRRLTSLFWNSFVTLKNTSDCSFCARNRTHKLFTKRVWQQSAFRAAQGAGAAVPEVGPRVSISGPRRTLLNVSPWLSRYSSFVMTCDGRGHLCQGTARLPTIHVLPPADAVSDERCGQAAAAYDPSLPAGLSP